MKRQDADETEEMILVRKSLKLDDRTKPWTLAAAIKLAKDSSLQVSEVCDHEARLKGQHTRLKKLKDRICGKELFFSQAAMTINLVIGDTRNVRCSIALLRWSIAIKSSGGLRKIRRGIESSGRERLM